MSAGWWDTAQLFGYLAFVLGVSSFLQKSDRRFKLFMAAECIAYVVHFSLLGVPTAAASSLVSVTRSVASLYTRSLIVALAFIAINVALGVAIADTWAAWLPLLASCIGTFALFRMQGVAMRLAMLVGTTLWVVNNVIAGSIGGTALEVVIAATNLYTIATLRRAPRAT